MSQPFKEPSTVTHEDGTIIVDGPDGVAFKMTAAAALITAGRLETEAMDALLERGRTETDPPREK